MTAVIVVGALVIVVLAIGSMALDEPTRDDARGRTSRRPPGTLERSRRRSARQ
ncbi:MAG: hypothetical protein HS111_29005 [Kofleriaceae bacterium]|nr:hypothetical protein [Kofleriaceae bacterium]